MLLLSLRLLLVVIVLSYLVAICVENAHSVAYFLEGNWVHACQQPAPLFPNLLSSRRVLRRRGFVGLRVQLYVHQSGKARLVIGGVSLVVHPGLPVSFVEQGVSIDSNKRTFCSFGQVREIGSDEQRW